MVRFQNNVKYQTNVYDTHHNQQYQSRRLDYHKSFNMQGLSCGQFYRGVINNLRSDILFTCQICCKLCQTRELQPLTKCEHNNMFCKKCLTIYTKIKLMTYQEIHCPKQDCKAILDKECNFWKIMPQQLQRRYNKFRASEQKLKDVNFRVCPQSKCDGNIIFKGKVFQCTVCSKQFCLNCLRTVHKGNCDFEDAGMLQSIFNLRRCPKCKFMIQKSAGCNYIKCICKFQFCYQCNSPYSPVHTCPRDSNYRVIMKRPKFKQESKIQTPIQKKAQIQASSIIVSQTTKFARSFQIVFITSFIIPYFLGLSLVFILKMALATILSLAELTIWIIVVVILGIGPFTIQFTNKFTPKVKLILLFLYPLAIIIGVGMSFKELSSSIVDPLLGAYLKKSKKIWKQLFA